MISAVVLTKNAQETLDKCLSSLNWCDEIVIIDDNSTDKTVRIAQKHKAKIYQHDLKENFAQQRNFGLNKAQEDWILFVDADELVSDQLKKEIQKVLNKPNKSGYEVRRQDFFWDKKLNYGETAQVKLLRLAKKSSGKWQGKVHETWVVKGGVGLLDERLIHQRQLTVSQFLTRINRYSSIRAKELYDKKIKSNWLAIMVYPSGKFLYNYILKLGFLDGGPGFVIAFMMSVHSFLVRAKLFMLWQHD